MARTDVPVALMGAEIREQPVQRRNASGFGCDSTRAPALRPGCRSLAGWVRQPSRSAARHWRRPSWSGYTIGRDWGYWEKGVSA